ncbi:hypothetical protein AGLY_016076, partial [Aphis glycines]
LDRTPELEKRYQNCTGLAGTSTSSPSVLLQHISKTNDFTCGSILFFETLLHLPLQNDPTKSIQYHNIWILVLAKVQKNQRMVKLNLQNHFSTTDVVVAIAGIILPAISLLRCLSAALKFDAATIKSICKLLSSSFSNSKGTIFMFFRESVGAILTPDFGTNSGTLTEDTTLAT